MSDTPSADVSAETPSNELFTQFEGILAGLSGVKVQINNLQQQFKMQYEEIEPETHHEHLIEKEL